MTREDIDARIMELWREGLTSTAIGREVSQTGTYVDNRIRILRRAGHSLPKRNKITIKPGPRNTHPAEKRPANPEEMKERRCLKCQTRFVSEWKGNRLCSGCQGSHVYSSIVAGYG